MANDPIDPTRVDVPKVEKDIETALSMWNLISTASRWVMYLLGITAISLSLYVSTFLESGDPKIVQWCSYAGTLSISLLSYFGVVSLGNRSRNAWRLLNAAKLKYHSGNITILEYIKFYEDGEKLMGEIDFTYTPAPRDPE